MRDARRYDALVAVSADKPIGLLVHRIGDTGPAELNIHWLGLYPKFHGKVAGTALIQATLAHATASDCRTVTVETLDPDVSDTYYLKTFAFYEKLGFVVSRKFAYEDGFGMVFMSRSV